MSGKVAQPRASHAHESRQHRKQEVLTRGRSSMVGTIADAVVLKDASLFFLCQHDGELPLENAHGLGLYYHDCRYLDGYEMRLCGAKLNPLVATAAEGSRAILELTNPEIETDGVRLAKETIGVRLDRRVDGAGLVMQDEISFHNFGRASVTLPLSFAWRASFHDVFAVRSLLDEHPGAMDEPSWHGGNLHFSYLGGDGVCRTLDVSLSPTPESCDGSGASLTLHVAARDDATLTIRYVLHETRQQANDGVTLGKGQRSSYEDVATPPRLESDNELLDRVFDRSLRDLRVLRSTLHGLDYVAAGVPWFVALFGRDSIIAALQSLAYDPEVARQTLLLLARYQGTKTDDWREESPGKILHELRVGELAHMDEIPHTPYYGSVDATPLFVMLIGEYIRWTGDVAIFEQLGDNVAGALEWMRRYGDSDGDGYIEYSSSSEKGLVNQGWKDSGDAIVQADGSLAEPPIALVEVQAYAYRAMCGIAATYRLLGEEATAQDLDRKAADLRERFNRDYWIEDIGTYALARERYGRPLDVVSSNPGHALWCGIADDDKAKRTSERLLAPDMYSGWGIRTLSTREVRYNPVGYHLGTVWPHDNAIFAHGLRSYGFTNEARRVFRGILEAATYFPDFRLPEVFAGFARNDYGVPVRYPVACHPQAWAAGSIPYLITSCLGLEPDAPERKLRISRPFLPDYTSTLTLKGLRIADARVDLRFAGSADDVEVDVLAVDGDLRVEVTEGEQSVATPGRP